MARYAIIEGGVAVNITPCDDAAYAAGKGWVEAETANIGDAWDGEHWTPAPAPAPAVPETVTRAQGKAALVQAGLWADVLAYVAGITDPTQQALAEIALHDTLEWRRDSPFLAGCAAGMGLTPAQLDALFIAASEIVL